jgi:hypothetical protein
MRQSGICVCLVPCAVSLDLKLVSREWLKTIGQLDNRGDKYGDAQWHPAEESETMSSWMDPKREEHQEALISFV